MKLDKKQIGNTLFVLLAVVLLFTPLGFPVKVFVNRLLSFSPNVIEESEQQNIEDYNWLLYDSDLKNFNLENAKGKVVFINIWATWCPPCVAEMPSIQELYSKYNKEVVFLIIAQDEAKRVDSYVKKYNYNFPIFYQKSNSPEVLSFDRIPTTFILNKDGYVVVKSTGSANWNSDSVRELLDTLLLQ
ncbi:TlpA disulfide reductase family protein [uncultured Maribacter sp.]|uniref:TlpA family protein disulfide reductase n=1 Tax=uncultured Maribacter sp. TaxID=431308 RepID=UPI00262FB551|nr:TlpA disulfide reductase family protein [uncultured Maribacter sp.]